VNTDLDRRHLFRAEELTSPGFEGPVLLHSTERGSKRLTGLRVRYELAEGEALALIAPYRVEAEM